MRYKLQFLGVLLIVLILANYWQTVRFSYVWDDWSLFVNDPSLRVFTGWADCLRAIGRPILPGTTYLRPMVLITFVGEFALLGPSAYWAHLINVLIHAFNTLLVFLLAAYMASLGRPWKQIAATWHYLLPSAFAALLYGVHPAMVEPVAWVAGRFDLLFTTFALLTILCALASKGVLRYVLVAAFILMAAFSKEMVVVVPLTLVLYYSALDSDSNRVCWSRCWVACVRHADLFIWLAVCGAVYLGIRFYVMGRLLHVDHSAVNGGGLYERSVLIGSTIILYAKAILVYVLGVSPQHPYNFKGMSPLLQFGSVLAICLAVGAFWKGLVTKGVMAPLLLAVAASLLPVLNILPLTIGGNVGHERFLVFPLSLAAVALAVLLCRLNARLRGGRETYFAARAAGGMGALLAAWLVNWTTLPMWETDLTLWGWAYSKHPDSEYVLKSYAAAAFRYGRFDELEKALSGLDQYSSDKGNLLLMRGALSVRQGRPEEGVRMLQEGLRKYKVAPPHLVLVESGISVSNLQADVGNFPYAAELSFAYGELAEGYLSMGMYAQALENVEVSRLYQRRYAPVVITQALSYLGMDDLARGQQYLAEAKRYILAGSERDVDNIRAQYVSKLCRQPERTPKVCAAFK